MRGFIDTSGSWLVTPRYGFTNRFSEGYAAVQELDPESSSPLDEPVGFIDTSGAQVIPARFGLVAGGFVDGLAAAKEDEGNWGFIDTTGAWAIPPQYDDALGFSEGLAAAQTSSGWGFIDATGAWVVTPQYDKVRPFRGGMAAVRLGYGAWGFVNAAGELAVPLRYSQVSDFSEGLAAVEADVVKWGFIDTGGALVIPAEFWAAGPFSGGMAAALTSDGWGFVDPSGAWVIPGQFADFTREYDVDSGVGAFDWDPFTTTEDDVLPRFLPVFTGPVATIPTSETTAGMINRAGQWVVAPREGLGRCVEGLARFTDSNVGGDGFLACGPLGGGDAEPVTVDTTGESGGASATPAEAPAQDGADAQPVSLRVDIRTNARCDAPQTGWYDGQTVTVYDGAGYSEATSPSLGENTLEAVPDGTGCLYQTAVTFTPSPGMVSVAATSGTSWTLKIVPEGLKPLTADIDTQRVMAGQSPGVTLDDADRWPAG